MSKPEGRNGFEFAIYMDLLNRGVEFQYEKHTLPYTTRVVGGECALCGHKTVVKNRKYLPDYTIVRSDDTVLIVEAKGRFPSTDRSKMRDVKKAYPQMDIRILFQKSSKKRMQEYSAWADKNGFPHAFGSEVPEHWL